MTYTPQAGDVWYGGVGLTVRFVEDRIDGVMRCDMMKDPQREEDGWVDGIAYMTHDEWAKYVSDHGWTLVHREGHDAVFNGIPFNWDRKEVQDGK